MRSVAVALVWASLLTFGFAPAPAFAKDVPLTIELDGRPLDANGPSGLIHRGKAYVNVVRFTRGFNGLLTFGKSDRSVRITIRRRTVQFVVGRRAGVLNDQPRVFPAAPFNLYGDIFVPLATMASVAQATFTIDVKHAIVHMVSAYEPVAP